MARIFITGVSIIAIWVGMVIIIVSVPIIIVRTIFFRPGMVTSALNVSIMMVIILTSLVNLIRMLIRMMNMLVTRVGLHSMISWWL